MAVKIPPAVEKELYALAEIENISYVEMVKTTLQIGISAIKEKRRNAQIYSEVIISEVSTAKG